MNLKLEKTNLTKYSIKDEKDQVIYTCEKKLFSLGDKILIYDENNLQLAEIKETPISKTKYKLYMNGSEIDQVIIQQKTPLESYILSNKKWLIAGDITYTDYKVTTENNDLILTMKCNLVDPDAWDITLNTTDKLLAVITIMTILSIAKK